MTTDATCHKSVSMAATTSEAACHATGTNEVRTERKVLDHHSAACSQLCQRQWPEDRAIVADDDILRILRQEKAGIVGSVVQKGIGIPRRRRQ